MPKPKNLLLTGATGFLGKIFTKELQAHFSITSLGRSPENDIVCNLAETLPMFASAFDYIIHNAGKAHIVPKTAAEKKAFYDVNYQGTLNLLKALEDLPIKPKSFILISTIAVYGRDIGENIDETHPLKGSSPYAASKIKAEEAVQIWCNNQEINCIILRLPLIIGPKAPGNLEAITTAIAKGRYPKIIGNTLEKVVF